MKLMKQSNLILGFLIAFCFLFYTQSLFADSSGLNTLSLFLDFFVGYDSNIVEYSDRIDDNYFTVIPKIRLSIPRDRSAFHIGYSMRYDNYVDESDFSNTSQNADLSAFQNIGENITISFSDKYVDSLYGLWRTETDSLSGEGYFINSLVPQLQYKSTSGFLYCKIHYDYSIEKWDELKYRDWRYDELSGHFGILLGEFTKIGIISQYFKKDYDSAASSDYNGYRVGLRFMYSLPEVIDISAFAGTSERTFDDIDKTSRNTEFELTFSKIFTELTSANLSVFYQPRDSEVYLGDFFDSYGGEVDVSYLFREKIQLFIKGQYLKNDYEFSSREDTLLRMYSGLGYKFLDWVAVQFFYNYLDRQSNFEEFDYSDSRLELHLNFFHDFHF